MVAATTASRSLTRLLASEPSALEVLDDLEERPDLPDPVDLAGLVRWKQLEYLRIAARDLLDPDVMSDVELELQRLAEGRRARGLDGLHDMLRDLGPLSLRDIEARIEEPDRAEELIDALVGARRAFPVRVGGEERLAAAEDLSRLRDALGVAAPQGVPESLLEPVEDPMGDVVGRFARTHGPFVAAEAASSLGLPVAAVTEVLRRRERAPA